MKTGQLRVGTLTLNEISVLNHGADGIVRVVGRESTPDTPMSTLEVLQENITNLLGSVVPVQFEYKSSYDGYYYVASVDTEFEKWPVDNCSIDKPTQSRWTLTLQKIGADNTVGMESSLTNTTRENDFALTGKRWHAPAIGHYAYFTGVGSTVFTTARNSEDGQITVYREIPAVNPRWGCPVDDFIKGRVRVTIDGIERVGTNIQVKTSNWELSNGLISVAPSGTGINIATYSGGAWHPKAWLLDDGSTISSFDTMTVIRNEYHVGAIRLVKSITNGGMILLDLTLRRGARFIEGYLQRSATATLQVYLASAEAFTDNSVSGYVVASGDDSDGNRFAIGSAKSFTAHANGGISKTNTSTLDFWIGTVVNGSSPATGDAATDLRDQYIGIPIESLVVFRR